MKETEIVACVCVQVEALVVVLVEVLLVIETMTTAICFDALLLFYVG